MTDVWVQIPFEDAEGKHGVNEKLTYSTDTDAEKHGLELMIEYGIVTNKEPPADTPADPAGRGRPGRRSS